MAKRNYDQNDESDLTSIRASAAVDAIGYDAGEGAAFVQGGEEEDDSEDMGSEIAEHAMAVEGSTEVESTLATPLQIEASENPGKVFDLYPEDINADPSFNGRLKPIKVTDKDVKEFAADIEQRGQLQPVQGYFAPDGSVNLAFGFRRHAAYLHLNAGRKRKDKLTIRIQLDATMDEHQAFLANLAENMQRKAVNIADIAKNIKRLSDAPFNLTGVQIGKELHLSPPSISLYKKVLGFIEENPKAEKLIEEGTLTRRDALDIAALDTPEKRTAALEKISPDAVGTAAKPKASKKEVKKAIKEAGGEKVPKMTVKEILSFCEAEGVEANGQAGVVLPILAGLIKREYKERGAITRMNKALAG